MKQFWLDSSKMTDGELADLISELAAELSERCNNINTGSRLRDQLKACALTIRSRTPQERRNMRFD